jgi:regulator of sigma E protease
MFNVLFTLLSFLVALMILITVHEFGHFWVARQLGIKVLRFSIGFGKPILKRIGKSGTEYVLSIIPLGGYVKMLDEREGIVSETERHLAFNRQSLLKRIAVVVAGPLFNVLFAIFAYWLMFVIGVSSIAPFVGKVESNTIAAQAGLKNGDEIIAIATKATLNWQDVRLALMSHVGEKNMLPISVRDEKQVERRLLFDLKTWQLDQQQPDPLRSLGFSPYIPNIPPNIDHVISGESGDKAGLRSGDRVTKINGRPLNDWIEFVNIVKQSPEKVLKVVVLRNHQTLALDLIPSAKTADNGDRYGYVGIQVKPVQLNNNLLRKEQYSLWGALWPAVEKTTTMLGLTFLMLWKLLLGSISFHTISGPVGIAIGAGTSASMGVVAYLQFLSLVSLSLAALNILPIPLLDGGYLFYFLIEGITRRGVSENMEKWGMRLGILFIAMLTIVAFYNDIMRLLG